MSGRSGNSTRPIFTPPRKNECSFVPALNIFCPCSSSLIREKDGFPMELDSYLPGETGQSPINGSWGREWGLKPHLPVQALVSKILGQLGD